MERVAILVATYNGGRYLSEQVDSILSQEKCAFNVFFSDDGSSDTTGAIIDSYMERFPDIFLGSRSGPRRGFAWNFISLLREAGDGFSYYSFSDQDDIWEPDKTARAVEKLRAVDSGVPAVYFARTRIVDESGGGERYSPLCSIVPSFNNALVQSLGGGNTMVVNGAARSLLIRVPEHADIASHDWLAYLLVTACGGVVIYDAYPCLKYRQHAANLVGANVSLRGKLSRVARLFLGQMNAWSRTNIGILKFFEGDMVSGCRRTLAYFEKSRTGSFFSRLFFFRKAAVFRRSRLENIGLWLAVMLRRT